MVDIIKQAKRLDNSATLQMELGWLHQVITTRMALYFGEDSTYDQVEAIPVPDLSTHSSMYADIVRHYKLGAKERLVLLLALSPHVCPQLLDAFFIKNEKYNRGFSEFGGLKGVYHSGFLPTGETAAFILAANDLKKRNEVQGLFDEDHPFWKYNMLKLERENTREPLFSGMMQISEEYLSYFTLGKEYHPKFSTSFPAQRLSTQLEWEDLVLDQRIIDEVQEILLWTKHSSTLLGDKRVRKWIKPGYRSLFYGPPGTGKTLTASLLGKTAQMEVYRIDLSKIVSKYIGETEKNLANIFDQAENKNWILFFDEADALFGKRTATSDAKDRYANQEVAFLLQRIEEFSGVVILATNLKTNLDEAFARRFQSMIYFPMPKPEHRLKLWEHTFAGANLDQSVNLWEIAQKYEMAGGAITNVFRYCLLNAFERPAQTIGHQDILQGIKKEFRKDGKMI